MNRKNLPKILKELASVNPDAAATDGALDRAKSALTSTPQLSLRAQIMHPRNLAAIAAGIAMVIILSQLIPASSGGNFAFGQVKEEVAKTKSVQYTEIRTNLSKDGKLEDEIQTKVKISGPSLERREVTSKMINAPNLPEGTFRLTTPDHTSVYDAMTGKTITLFPDRKGYVVPHSVMSLNDDGSVKTSTIKAAPKADFYARIQELPADPVKRLPEQMIGGKTAVGFVYEDKRESQRGEDKFTRTVWTDVKTKLPVRIDVAFRSTNPAMAESDWVMKDFVFDAPLDQKLFSCDPPAGYVDLEKVAVEEPKPVDGKRTKFVFADVQKEVANTQSVRYDETSLVVHDGVVQNDVAHVSILGGLIRREVKYNAFTKDGIEVPESTRHSIAIVDTDAKKKMEILPEQNKYSIKSFAQLVLPPGAQPAGLHATMFSNGQIYERVRGAQVDAEQLPEQLVSGRPAIGFRSVQTHKAPDVPGGVYTWRNIYWVDRETRLPLEIEVNFRTEFPDGEKNAADGHPRFDHKIHNIVFDVPLDTKLFSFDPPEGYVDLGKVAEVAPPRIAKKKAEFVFADVQEEVAKVRSAQYSVKETKRADEKGPIGVETNGRVLILGDKKREELNVAYKVTIAFDFSVTSKITPATTRRTQGVPEALGEKIRNIPGVDRVVGISVDRGLLAPGVYGFIYAASVDAALVAPMKILEGSSLTEMGDREVLLGSKLAAYLRKKAGDKLAIEGEDFTIVGIYSYENGSANGSILTTLAGLRRLTNREGIVDYLDVWAKQPADAEALERLREQLASVAVGFAVNSSPNATYASVAILDKQAGKTIRLSARDRTFATALLDSSVLNEQSDSDALFAGAARTPPADFYELIRTIPSDATTQVGERLINGHKCTGFLVERTRTAEDRKSEKSRNIEWVDPQTDTWRRTYWIDQQSKLPVEIETSFRSDAPMSYDADAVYSDFVFDAELDPVLFSTDPPAGYRDINAKKSEDSTNRLRSSAVLTKAAGRIFEKAVKSSAIRLLVGQTRTDIIEIVRWEQIVRCGQG